jgi:DNA-binding MarR family transcriptional regulator
MAMKRPVGPVREPLTCVLIKLGHLLEQQMNRELADEKLGVNQYLALIYIASHPKISRAELARGLCVTPQAAGALTGQLVEAGLLARTPHRPGRPIELELTSAGVTVIGRASPGVGAREARMHAPFRPALRAPIDRALRHLLSSLRADDEPINQ